MTKSADYLDREPTLVHVVERLVQVWQQSAKDGQPLPPAQAAIIFLECVERRKLRPAGIDALICDIIDKSTSAKP